MFDTVICISGGTGVTPCLGMLEHIVSKYRGSPAMVRTKKLVFVWFFRDASHFEWAHERFRSASQSSLDGLEVEFRFYITGTYATKGSEVEGGKEKSIELGYRVREHEMTLRNSIQTIGQLSDGRASVQSLVNELLTPGRNFVLGCGPGSLSNDIAHACASAQARAMRGEIAEIALHTEAFGW
ncbi:hypothetical protein EJ08DRAFT_527108 [Tothia fuscella]|uniref:Ferric reductase NAD binding domain-containing protein n=1 Tax=Tothia fuscella TaxID=1048955 RepID=A0A9P4NH04_9PEZI|nr:hypothetical protein EJ08DRAFT_527108 [Tothia fuscella]